MRIALIKPNIGRLEHSLYVDEGRMEPLQLGVLAGLTPPDVEVVLHDDRIEAIPYDEPVDLVAITVETFTARRAYEIAETYRRRKVPVVMGGFQATLIPEEVQEHCDSVFIGDAEEAWLQVLEDARRRRLRPVYHCPSGVGQRGSFPRRDLFRGKGYLPFTLVQFSRGCAFACTYCAVSVFFRRQIWTRDVREVVEEIERAEPRLVFFVDDNITAHRAQAKELFRALIPLRIRWVGQASIDMVDDSELMELMRRSGCLGHVIGFESLDSAALKEMGKAPNLRAGDDRYRHAIAVLRDHGLQTWAAFTLGHDTDTLESIEATLEFSLRNKFAFAAFNLLMPYPGTPLYDRLRQEDRLLFDGRWWLHPSYRFNHAAFVPKNMEPDELTEACFAARSRFSSASSIVRRFFEPRTNMRSLTRMAVYWGYNPLFRREVFKKQGMRFGLEGPPR